MSELSDELIEGQQCSDCGGDTRLLADLSGVTGDAGYELWHCERCGLQERIGTRRQTIPALPRSGYGAISKQTRARARRL
jgi:hypothetical protein